MMQRIVRCDFCGSPARYAATVDQGLDMQALGIRTDPGLRFLDVEKVQESRRTLYRDCCASCSFVVLQQFQANGELPATRRMVR